MAFQVAAQNATGEIGGPATRARNFSLLALGYSVSGFIGPLIAGFAIDHFGFRAAFALFALIPLIPIVVLARGALALPGPHRARARVAHHGGVARAAAPPHAAPRVRGQRAAVAGLGPAHDLRADLRRAGSACRRREIGVVLSSFAAATFVVRFFDADDRAPADASIRCSPAALLLAGAVFFVFPFLHERAGADRAVVHARTRARAAASRW